MVWRNIMSVANIFINDVIICYCLYYCIILYVVHVFDTCAWIELMYVTTPSPAAIFGSNRSIAKDYVLFVSLLRTACNAATARSDTK